MEERLFKNYEWQTFADAPWKHLSKDISESKVALLTTGGIYNWKATKHFNLADENGDPTFREIKKNVSQEDIRIAHRHVELKASVALDVNCLFPIDLLLEMEKERKISAVSESHFSLMGEVKDPGPILDESVPKIIKQLNKFMVDVVIVSAVGPWSHQTAALIARELEEAEICTIMISCMRTVSANIKPPRTVLVRFPFGQPFGAPFDRETHKEILAECLVHVKSIREPGEIAELGLRWRDTFAKGLREYPQLRSVVMGSAESDESE